MTKSLHPETLVLTTLKKLNTESRKLVLLDEIKIARILREMADATELNIEFLIQENAKDLAKMDENDPKYDRLLLDETRLRAIAGDLRKVASLPSPLNRVLEVRTQPNGLEMTKISVSLGVVGIVYESRPNVTFDVIALCLKSGNAAVLKGSRDAHDSNVAIVKILKSVLAKYGLQDVVYLVPSEREALGYILNAVGLVDVIIPRGSQSLIEFVRQNSKVPVIETGAGIVHAYFDKYGDLEKGKNIIENSKARRVSVCNALDTLIIHVDRINDLPELVENLDKKHQCTIYADDWAYRKLRKSYYTHNLLHQAEKVHFGTEFLSMKMSIKTVHNMEDALEHIATYSSKHSETIITESVENADYFFKMVDAAVVYANAATSFTDGAEFGFGAEIGISTQKLHARGPMALRELTSYKWIVKGNGQIR